MNLLCRPTSTTLKGETKTYGHYYIKVKAKHWYQHLPEGVMVTQTKKESGKQKLVKHLKKQQWL